jgi:anti-sigma B factor antagonist
MEAHDSKREEKMEIKITSEGNERVIAVEGRLDTLTAPELQPLLIDAVETGERTVLDFAELEYVSSAGLRVLLLAEKSSQAVGSEFVIRTVSAEVMEVFEMTGFADILTIE